MRAVFAALLVAAAALAQTPAPGRNFEVASIRPRTTPYGTIDISTSGVRLTAEAATLRYLILWAYHARSFQIADSPALLAVGDTPYDIAAKAEGDTAPTAAQFREMLQALLADRFQLKVHRERRPAPVYALVLARGGPKFKPSAPGADPGGHMGISGRNNVMRLQEATMEDLAAELENTAFLDRPVVDRTGLAGTYDLNLTYTPENRMGTSAPDAADVSTFTALPEQLGLRLVPQRAEIELLVVDRAEKPAQN